MSRTLLLHLRAPFLHNIKATKFEAKSIGDSPYRPLVNTVFDLFDIL